MLQYITWNVDPMLIDSVIKIRWYGLMFAVGFWIGLNLVAKMFRHEGAPEKWLGLLLIWIAGATIIGSRLGHVFFYEWDFYSQHPEKILAFWEGGLASHGGTIAIIIAIFLFSWITTKLSPLWTFDRIVAPIALVGCLIRIGNLMNSEIFGHATDLPWGFMFQRSYQWQQMQAMQPDVPLACHPTQIYEALAYLAIFVLLMWMYWRKNAQSRPGLLLGTFLTTVFGARFIIEFVKNVQEPWELDMMATYGVNMGQLLSVPFVIAGIILIIYAMRRPKVPIKYDELKALYLARKKH